MELALYIASHKMLTIMYVFFSQFYIIISNFADFIFDVV